MDDGATALGAVLMLGGGLRPSPLGYAVGVSPLDLEIMPGVSVAQRWVQTWRSAVTGAEVSIRCLVARGAPTPASLASHAPSDVSIEVDRREFCGPAGAVRDAVASMPPEETIAVNEAATFPAASMAPLLSSHVRSGAEATIAMNPDGSPAGVYVFRAGLFRDVSAVGFTDLKEQFLDRLRLRGTDIRVHMLESPGGLPLRTRVEFLQAAHIAAGRAARGEGDVEPAWLVGDGEDIRDSTLSTGVRMRTGARVIGSVIMTGAAIEPGAVVVRSIVCAGATVREGQQVVDSVVTPQGVRNDAWASARARWRQKA